MKIGILSDSHDALLKIRKAVQIFTEKKVDGIIHGGDFIAPFSVAILSELTIPWWGVLGNNDGEVVGIFQKSKGLIHSYYQEIKFNPYRIWVSHYYQPAELAFQSGRYDLSIFGHTHEKKLQEEKGRFLLNPGESCGLLTGVASIAVCDLKNKEVEFIEI